jgi:TRAP-type C4-dicarboxylate transport system permease small subunit
MGWRRFLDAAALPFGYAAALCLTFMMVFTTWSVLARYAIGWTYLGDVDLMVLALGGCVFVGIPAVTLKDEHVVVDLVDQIVGAGVRRVLRWIGLACTLVFMALTFYFTMDPALEKLRFGETSMSIGLNLFWYFLPVLIGLAFSAIATVLVALYWLRDGPPDLHTPGLPPDPTDPRKDAV